MASSAVLAVRLGVPLVVVYDEVDSTMDDAHRLAQDGAVAGTVVVASRQRAGRGRLGRPWASRTGSGVWVTVIERPRDPTILDILSVRLGLRVAEALDRFAAAPVRVKWPNDLYLASGGKVGGILCEARWHGSDLAWVAIGLGVNLALPVGVSDAAALDGARRLDVLAAVVPALRAGAAVEGGLTP